MVTADESPFGVVQEGRRFFQNVRVIHIAMAAIMFGTGGASVALSSGSDGTTIVPYFFSSFIAGAWQILLLILAQVCIYFLSGDIKRSSGASTWVTVYSITHSIFVLFNVMGVVFSVTSGTCLEGQQCYYDHNEAANRGMAILLIVEHCACILFSIFLAKRAHVIDSELEADIAIKLNHHIIFNSRTRRRSSGSCSTSTFSSASSFESSSSIKADDNADNNTTDIKAIKPEESEPHKHVHRGVHRHRRSKSYSRASAFAIGRHRNHNNASKSFPNLHRHHDTKIASGAVVEGKIFSIYSDSELKPHSNNNGKPKLKSNRVQPMESVSNQDLNSTSNSVFMSAAQLSGDTMTSPEHRQAKENPNIMDASSMSLENFGGDNIIDIISDNSGKGEKMTRDAILKQQQVNIQNQQMQLHSGQIHLNSEQERLQREQRELMEQQKQYLLLQQQTSSSTNQLPPPPYEKRNSLNVESSLVNVKEAVKTIDLDESLA